MFTPYDNIIEEIEQLIVLDKSIKFFSKTILTYF